MCGIAGIIHFDPRETVDADRLRRMCDALRHRGPDGAGQWIEGPVGLGHRRLAIVDVAGGAQPMTNEDGALVIVHNGETYNHPSLRPELEAKGHRYRTRSDTETILHLYEEEGERCVERLRGMFAFALWDRREGRLLLARDRLGIKPLYYACSDRELLFASEIKAILAAGPLRAVLNDAVLPEFLATRFVAGEETFFRGVRKLLPGRTLGWSLRRGFRQRRYWHLPAASAASPSTLREEAAIVRGRLEEAVRVHLMSDVPLGLFLSGGIDSTGIAALAARMVDGPIRTFAVGFAEKGANELAYARLAARAIQAEHREVVVSADQFFRVLPRLVWHEDEPIAFPSSVPLYFVSRLAAEHVKVVLTGEGADELFLGYNRYRVTSWNERLGAAYGALVPGALRGAVARAVGGLPGEVRRYAGRTFVGLPPGPRGLFFENFAVFSEARQRMLLADPGRIEARDPYAEALRCYGEAGGASLRRMSHADLQTYLVELLMKQDQMSMAASIESRVPYLDHELVDYTAALPARLKLRGFRTKAILREALRDLVPPEILTRRKMGFPVPLGRWLRDPLPAIVDEFALSPRALRRGLFEPAAVRRLADEHRAGAAEHGDRLWLLVNLEIWQRVFIDREDLDEVMAA
ncbi:MAG: asparagine synthase (glutamine-hydrolyzing) [Acidobacteria bacterium 13_1_40CM_4_69_4]|nr:MAG: asparagine synthase (glutamine-hydrolyzing) [Acidobacteria bacterium 13_1_40CM_4_69_4]